MAQPVFQALGTGVSGIGTLAPAWPTHQANDIALLFIETANQAPSETTSGWTSLTGAGTGTAGAAGSVRCDVYWKRAASSSEAAAGVSDSGDHQVAQILTFRGCAVTGTPVFLGSAGSVTPAQGAVSTAPGSLPATSDSLVVIFVANATDTATAQTSGWTNANLTNLTERTDFNAIGGVGGGFGVATGGWVGPGDYGTTTATLATSSKQRAGNLWLIPPPPVAGTIKRNIQAVNRASTY